MKAADSRDADPRVCNVPVAMFIFNRAEPAAAVLRAVARVRPRWLLVSADGPRPDRPGESKLCEATRAVIDAVDWPCKVSTRFLPHNLGIGAGMSSGLDWVFSQTDRAILLEDDCVPNDSFFAFCEAMLERYRDDDRVSMVRGSCFPGSGDDLDASYRFSRYHNIWGWASWSRAWKHYDGEMRAWPELRRSRFIEEHVRAPGAALLLKALLDHCHAGKLKTWDLRWWYSCWRRDALAVAPDRNMVTNIGQGPQATHATREGIAPSQLESEEMPWPLRHPQTADPDPARDDLEWAYMRRMMARPPRRPAPLPLR